MVLIVITMAGLLLDKVNFNTEKRVQTIFAGIIQVWVSLFTICSMVFQLKVIESPLVTNCTFPNSSLNITDQFLLKPQDNLQYIGIFKSADIQENLRYYIIIFLLLTFDKVVKLKMKYKRLEANKDQTGYRVLFENVTWKHLDVGLIHFVKYMANFGFYRFGLEVSLHE
jgi:hypothetical protein